MRGRPLLYTSYGADQAVFPTATQRVAMSFTVLVVVLIPLQVLPGIKFLGDADWLTVIIRAMIIAIGALGLTLLTGLAGQVSIGHSFFMGVGAYTAVVLGGESTESLWGLGLPIWVWLPMAGIVPALVGIAVAPTAVRVRGLYLAFVTLGLVFIGEHLWRTMAFVTGGPGLGRKWPALQLRLWKEENPLIDFAASGPWFGVELSRQAKSFYLVLALLILFAIVTKNISRTRLGRAFMAIRDRDIAAEIMGVARGTAQDNRLCAVFVLRRCGRGAPCFVLRDPHAGELESVPECATGGGDPHRRCQPDQRCDHGFVLPDRNSQDRR